MPSIRRILLAVRVLDANSLPTMLKATQSARACRAEVEIYHCLNSPAYADLDVLAERSPLDVERIVERIVRERVVQRLETTAARLRRHQIKVSVCTNWDFPIYEAIVRRAMHIKADLIIASAHAGSHRLPSLMRLTDWEFVRLSPVPILVVKDRRLYRHPTVLAAIDPTHAFAKPSGLDNQILKLGRAISQKLRGSLHAVHAYARVLAGGRHIAFGT